MKTLTRRAVGSVGALALFLTFPSFSAALDCSYNNAFIPPLPVGGIGCVASGSLKSKGKVEIPPSSPMEMEKGLVLKLPQVGGSPGSLIIQPDAKLVSEVSFPELTDSVIIDAATEIFSVGHLEIFAPEEIIRLRASGGSVQLLGQGATGSTIIIGDSIKLESAKKNIVLDGVLISAEYVLELNATKGDISIANSILAAEEGACRFNAKHVVYGPNNIFLCEIVAP